MANTNKKTERQMIAVKMKDADYEYLKPLHTLTPYYALENQQLTPPTVLYYYLLT